MRGTVRCPLWAGWFCLVLDGTVWSAWAGSGELRLRLGVVAVGGTAELGWLAVVGALRVVWFGLIQIRLGRICMVSGDSRRFGAAAALLLRFYGVQWRWDHARAGCGVAVLRWRWLRVGHVGCMWSYEGGRDGVRQRHVAYVGAFVEKVRFDRYDHPAGRGRAHRHIRGLPGRVPWH